MRTIVKGNVILPDKVLTGGMVLMEGERISSVSASGKEIPDKNIPCLDYGDKFISPGLIDLHLHGALGKDVMDGKVESLKKIAWHQAACGVTGFLGSTSSASMDAVLKAVEAIKKAQKLQLSSELLGVYIEGPFLNPKKKGAQDPAYIQAMKREDVDIIVKAVRGLKTIFAMAPEVNNNLRFIPVLKEGGLVVSIGHSDATHQQAVESFNQGITHATHLYNAMRKFLPREPGVVGAVLDSARVTAEIIADGVHVHPASVRLAVFRKGSDKICLITDSVKASGRGDGIYQMGDLEIVVKGEEARLRKSGVLAGSVLTLNRAVKNVAAWTGLPVHQVVGMASLNPARVLGMEDRRGSIQEGKLANLVVFDREFNVRETILRGQRITKS
ncbi:MAG: N-acetylglucosamine-6-phosphate deacetylase [Candidatus Aminicenantes bacterium]